MIVWSSSPWSSRTLAVPPDISPNTVVYRAVAEVVYELSGAEALVTRAVAEVIHPVGFIVPLADTTVYRAVAEVVGLAKEFVGRHAVTTRALVEIVHSFAEAHRGFYVPDLTVDAVSVAFSADLDLSGPGQISLIDADGRGYTLYWTSASPATLTETWRGLAGTITNVVTTPVGRIIRSFVLPVGTGQVVMTDFATTRPPERPAAGSVQEILLWNRGLDAGERSYIETYLRCKWIPESCTNQPLTPSQQQTLVDGLIASSNTSVNPAYGELLDDLRASPGFLEFLGCQGAELPPTSPDEERPFRIDNPDYSCPVADCSPCREYVPIEATIDPQFMADPQASAQQLVGLALPGFGVVVEANAERTIGNPDPCAYSIRVRRANNDEGLTGFTSQVRTPPPEFLYLTMAEFLALTDYCIMFDDLGQDIIDSDGYIGEIPEGMEPSEP